MLCPFVQGLNNLDRRLVTGEQDPTAENRPTQPHRRPLPEATDAVIEKNAFDGFQSARTRRALRPCFDDIKGL